jgi:predicted lysophospholipase L1 biosynthesis ABC-type transport system permease subunit
MSAVPPPDAFWHLLEPLVPALPPQPNGGGFQVSDRAGLSANTFLLHVAVACTRSVDERERFAVRLALGANTRDLLRAVIGEGARLTAIGVGLGVAGSLLAMRVLARLLFGVTPTDPTTLTGVVLLLVVTGVLASYVPARRAMRVAPVTALQAE